ncbi:hypothetical protein [Caulobacter segnis]
MLELPSEGDRNAVFAFAMSFNGYEHYGSFEASSDAARSMRRDTLEDIRNELFFAVRASRHRDDDAFLDTSRELLPLLRALGEAPNW